MTGKPLPGAGPGSVTPLGQCSLSHTTQFTLAVPVPVPWLLTAAAPASLLPEAVLEEEVTPRKACWEVGARLGLGFGPCI